MAPHSQSRSGTSFIVNAWDQNAALPVMSPISASHLRDARRWTLEVLGLAALTATSRSSPERPSPTPVASLRPAMPCSPGDGWDVQRDGLFGAPEIHVVIGEKAHSTLRKSLGLIGLGRERVTVVPSDDQGRHARGPPPDRSRSRCARARVRPGRRGEHRRVRPVRRDRRVGRGARAGGSTSMGHSGSGRSPIRLGPHLVAGLDRADSWATDGHKWLNVTYDCGIAIVRRPGALRRTFAAVAGYLPPDVGFEAMHHTPQSSQRARQIEVWAVLRTLGRSGRANAWCSRRAMRPIDHRGSAARWRVHHHQRRRTQSGARACSTTRRSPSD